MTDGEKYIKVLNEIESFKEELKALIDKYNFGLFESEEYDGEENCIGVTLYFKSDEYIWFDESVESILAKSFK